MKVYRRADKRSTAWYVDFTDDHDSRQRKSLGRHDKQRQAEEAAWSLIQAHNGALRGATGVPGGRPGVTLADALRAYTASLRAENKPSSRTAAMHENKCFGKGAFMGRFGLPEDLLLHDLKPAMLSRLVAARRAEGNGNQAIAHELKDIRAATRHAAADGFRTPEDMLNGALRNAWRMPTLTAKTRYLTKDELEQLFAYLDPDRPLEVTRGGASLSYALAGSSREGRQDNYDLAVCLAYGGERWGEIARLRWDQVDTERLRLWSKALTEGREPPAVTITVYGSKTQAHRLVGCPERVCRVLYRRWQLRKIGQELVFPSSKTGKARVAGNRAIITAMDRLGFNTEAKVAEMGRATVHSLRHTYASLLLQNGASLPEIQDALGHTNITTTRRYAHLARKESAGKLAGILNGI